MSPAKDGGTEPNSVNTPVLSKQDDSCDISTMYRLPEYIVPSKYRISAGFDIPGRSYKGNVDIYIDFHQQTEQVYLNAKNLEVWDVVLINQASENKLTCINLLKDDSLGVYRFDFPQTIDSGKYIMSLKFSGKIRTGLQGVYLNRYMTEEGKEEQGVATMFAATEARSFLPCFDQPDMKAVFEVDILVESHLSVLSNMNCTSAEIETHDELNQSTLLKRYRFAASPVMSTYLLCFIIGQYSSISTTVDGVPVSVFAPVNREHEGEFSLSLAVKCLRLFNEYFGIKYTLPKLDLIALSCISVGAMENWGLITFRENQLLIDPENASRSDVQRTATIVAHEISHQWFGNLTTMRWWSDLWLNEGFATFMQYHAIDLLHPEFNIWDQFCSGVLINSLELDALENSHPIQVKVNNPLEIDEVFDRISYRKGASVIWLLYNLIGETAFKQGIRQYMQKYNYSNASTEDLWQCLGHFDGKPVSTIMDAWLTRVGFPLVSVQLQTQDGEQTLTLGQTRFSSVHKDNKDLVWCIPVRILIKPSAEEEAVILPSFLFDEENCDVPIPKGITLDINNGGFVKVNTGFVSYFRTDYSMDLNKALEEGLINQKLSAVDRLSTIEEKVSLVLREKGNTVRLLKLLSKLTREDSYLVWMVITNFFHVLRCIVWKDDVISAQFDHYVVSVLEPCLDRIGYLPESQESHLNKMMRAMLVSQLGLRGCDKVVKQCVSRFRVLAAGDADPMNWESLLKKSVMKVAMAASADDKVLEVLLRRLEDPQDRQFVLYSLGYSSNPDVLHRVLELSLSPKLRDQEAVIVLESVCQNRRGYPHAWRFFRDNFKHFYERYGHGLFLMATSIKSVTENFASSECLLEAEQFFDSVKYVGCERTIRQAKENVGLNITWREKEFDSVSEYLKSF